ncbi:MAG: hypothetical protein AAGD05_07425, partial [Bacteroidota bacterium]
LPIVGAIVRLGTETKETDQNGVFLFRDVEVNSTRAYLEASKAGYFEGSRTILPQGGAISTVRIQLLPNEEIGTIAAAAGGDFVLPGGTVISFPANSVQTLQGGIYNGTIHIAAQALDPTVQSTAMKMPGDLTGVDANDQKKALVTYGLLAIELRDDNGVLLQLARDQSLTVTLPLSDELVSSAPANTALWYFDAEEGTWKESGTAQRSGNSYVGQIDQLTFWNAGVPFDLVEIRGKVVDPQGEPFSGIQVNVKYDRQALLQSGWTSSNGNYTAKVPAGAALSLEILNECANANTQREVGPFGENTVVPELMVSDEEQLRTITGKVFNCANEPVANAYVKINTGTSFQLFYTESDGDFNASIIGCNSNETIRLVGANLGNNAQSAAFIFTTGNTIAAGNILACDGLEEYISFTLDGERFLNTTPFAGKDNGASITDFGGDTPGANLFMSDVMGAGLGNFNVDQLTVNGLVSDSSGLPNVTVTFTAYGDIGEVITGTFGGDFIDNAGTDHVISGSFRIQRDN